MSTVASPPRVLQVSLVSLVSQVRLVRQAALCVAALAVGACVGPNFHRPAPPPVGEDDEDE